MRDGPARSTTRSSAAISAGSIAAASAERSSRSWERRFVEGAVSRVVARVKQQFAVWQQRSLTDERYAVVFLDGIHLRVRLAGRVVVVPILAALGVTPTGQKQLVALPEDKRTLVVELAATTPPRLDAAGRCVPPRPGSGPEAPAAARALKQSSNPKSQNPNPSPKSQGPNPKSQPPSSKTRNPNLGPPCRVKFALWTLGLVFWDLGFGFWDLTSVSFVLQYDVFTREPLTGNQLAVFVEARGLGTDVRMRIFTPAAEMADGRGTRRSAVHSRWPTSG